VISPPAPESHTALEIEICLPFNVNVVAEGTAAICAPL